MADETQPWECEKCGTKGTVTFDENAGVYEVRDLLANAHHDANEGCGAAYGITKVRADVELPNREGL